MFKTTISAAALVLALSGSAFAQTGAGAAVDAEIEAGSCTSVLADLDNRVDEVGDAVGGVVDGVGGAVGGVTGGLGLGATAGADTPVGSADASANASADVDTAGAVDLDVLEDLRERAQAALDSGDEAQCLELAAEADQALSAGVQ